MTKQEHIEYWLKTAEDDLNAAENLLKSRNFQWCLFIGHLVLEKVLKAHFVNDNQDNFPPKTHDLIRLSSKIRISLSEDQLNFLEEVNEFNIEARYPEVKKEMYLLANPVFSTNKFNQIKDMYRWLKSNLKY